MFLQDEIYYIIQVIYAWIDIFVCLFYQFTKIKVSYRDYWSTISFWSMVLV